MGLGALRSNICKGETSWTEQREKLNCDTIETETLTDPTRSSGAGMAFWGTQVIMYQPGCPKRKGHNLGQDNSLQLRAVHRRVQLRGATLPAPGGMKAHFLSTIMYYLTSAVLG